ncbi:hypothetical protein CBR_g22326 [Chara braunii]|uniref:Importin N-terminal domain-containing protein n=1 Tax=Chara braunii TaxID=69332 RepID=A0A388JUN8_CHABU|nr:hypothetical protein CBR_g22326 [Chara braunii]|eukprot:GBG61529.1 hypothetical protein CBR_g22326 [Chara braunii]
MAVDLRSEEGQTWLLQCLQAALAADASSRVSAEEALRTAGRQPGFGVALSKVVLSAEIPYGVRQLAAVVLKQFVKEAWKIDSSESDKKPMQGNQCFVAHPEDKAFIKEFLPNALGDPEGKIRTAVGIVIATIAQKDWPEEWPGLMEFLLHCIRDHSSVERLHGALRCLSLFADEIDDSQMPSLVPVLFPELFKIFSSPDVYGVSVHRLALVVLHSCISTLGIMSGAFQNETKALMSPMLKSWMEYFSAVLSRPTTAQNADDWSLKMWVLKVLMQVVVNFPKLAAAHVQIVLHPLWQLFVGCAAVYDEAAGAESPVDLVDSDGDELSLEALIIQMFEFLISLVGQPRFRKVVAGSVSDLVYHTIGLMKMTRHQVETWSTDPNQYISDEDDLTFSCRVSGAMLLEEVVAAFDTKGVSAIQLAVQKRLVEAAAARSAGNAEWWKMREAAILAIGTVSEALLDPPKGSKGSSTGRHAVLALLESLLYEDLGNDGTSCPFLRGRALWAASRLSTAVPGNNVVPYLEAAVRGLGHGNPVPIMVGACRALSQFCPKIGPETLRPCLPAIYHGVGSLLQQATEETLHLVLETLLVAVKADSATAAAMEPSVSPAVLNIWAAHITDPLISVDASDVIEAIADIPECVESLLVNALPALSRVLSTNTDQQTSGIIEGALDMLTMFLNKAPPHMVRNMHDSCFNGVVFLAMKSEDNGELQSAAECLAGFLRAAGPSILEWSAAGPEAALKGLLDVCARLLSPDLDASGSLYVGSLLVQMLRQFPGLMAPHVQNLVRALVVRMSNGSTPNLEAELILVFARLVHMSVPNVSQFLDLLSSVPVDGHGNALPFVLSHWVEHEDLVEGDYQMKVSSTALALILASCDPRLALVKVKGQMLRSAEGSGMVTRSRSRSKPVEWTSMSLPAKILGILADVMSGAQEGPGIAMIEEEEEEWEEAEDEDELEDNEDAEDIETDGAADAGAETGKSVFQPAEGIEGLSEDDLEDGDYREDPDAASDPINKIDLGVYLKEVVDQFASKDKHAFAELCKELTEEQKAVVWGTAALMVAA